MAGKKGARYRNDLTQERVKELFDYNELTGVVTRKITTGNRAKAGSVVGYVNSLGYLEVTVDGKAYRLHRVIYLWKMGFMPEHIVDHENHRRTDNRWCNLRHLTQGCNARNCDLSKNNTSGVNGISWSKTHNKWEAYIKFEYQRHYLGIHEDFVEAVFHRLTAEVCLGWKVCDSSSSAFTYLVNNGFIKSDRIRYLSDGSDRSVDISTFDGKYYYVSHELKKLGADREIQRLLWGMKLDYEASMKQQGIIK